ncbi:SpvB/TcaC N-terminal domain-containing protein, partial [Aliikangiella maris]
MTQYIKQLWKWVTVALLTVGCQLTIAQQAPGPDDDPLPNEQQWYTDLMVTPQSGKCTILQNQGDTTCTLQIFFSATQSPEYPYSGTITNNRTFRLNGVDLYNQDNFGFHTITINPRNNYYSVLGSEVVPNNPNAFSGTLIGEYEDYTPLFTHSSSTHNVIRGNFNGSYDEDALFQSKIKGGNTGLMPFESNGYLDTTIHKAWTSAHPQIPQITDWSAESYAAFSGNFNANPGDELLLLGRKTIVLLHGDIITPIVIFPPVQNAIVGWNASHNASYSEFAFDANPADYEVHIGDLNADGFDEIFLQAKFAGSSSHILSNTGALIQTIPSGYLNIDWSAQSYVASIENGGIQLNYIGNSAENNFAVTNASGAVSYLQIEVTQPTITADVVRYVYAGEDFSFYPQTTPASGLIFSSTGGPDWFTNNLNSNTGEVNTLVDDAVGNGTFTITVSVIENKPTHRIPASYSFKLDVISPFIINYTDYDVYITTNGNIYLKAKNGSAYYQIKRDGEHIWMIKITQTEFNNASATLSDKYQAIFTDFDQDGQKDLVVLPIEDISLQSFAITSIEALQHDSFIGGARDFGVPDSIFDGIVVPANENAGAVEGNGGVSGGSANYSIPIAIPPGRVGMQPNVSLNYSSTSGNGPVGIGWSISATASISRCAQTEAHDGRNLGIQFNSDDRLCYNGNRLIPVSGAYGANGTVYRTELDSFAKVTQNGALNESNTSFTVEQKNGRVLYFGIATNSRVIPDGVSQTLRWLLAREEDRSTNRNS